MTNTIESDGAWRRVLLGAVAAGVVGISGPASAAIVGISNTGAIYSIDTSNATASFLLQGVDAPGAEPNSPNGLATSGGSYFYTEFNTNDNDRYLYKDAGPLPLATLPTGGGAIAAGSASNGDYYYIAGNGQMYVVGDVNGAVNVPVSGVQVTANPSAFGDIAISGDTMYLSVNNEFGSIDLNNNTYTKIGDAPRYAGLAFDGSTLFGFTANGTTLQNELYSINLGTGAGTLVGEIVIDNQMLTDAAPVIPLPATALLLAGGLSGFGFVRMRRKSRKA